MHVLLVSTRFHPWPGGIESMVATLARGLAAAGDQVTVLTRRPPGLPAREDRDGYRVVRVGREGGGHAVAALRFLAGARRWLAGEERVDVIHAHSLYSPALLSVLTGIPTVATLHTIGPGGNVADLLSTVTGRLRLRLYRRRLVRLVALNRAVAEELLAAGFPQERIAVIPNGVDTRHFRPPTREERVRARQALDLPAEAVVVAFLGRGTQEKGLDLFLAAGRGLPETTWLLVATEQPDRVLAQPRLRVVPVGEAALRIYQAADLFVMPSRTEAFGLAALEAMACGVPVVAARVGGLPELLGETGILVPPEDPGALRAAVLGLIQAPERREALGTAARARAEGVYPSERIVRLHRRLYEEVLAQGGSGGSRVGLL